jgi:hypothetical protein
LVGEWKHLRSFKTVLTYHHPWTPSRSRSSIGACEAKTRLSPAGRPPLHGQARGHVLLGAPAALFVQPLSLPPATAPPGGLYAKGSRGEVSTTSPTPSPSLQGYLPPSGQEQEWQVKSVGFRIAERRNSRSRSVEMILRWIKSEQEKKVRNHDSCLDAGQDKDQWIRISYRTFGNRCLHVQKRKLCLLILFLFFFSGIRLGC